MLERGEGTNRIRMEARNATEPKGRRRRIRGARAAMATGTSPAGEEDGARWPPAADGFRPRNVRFACARSAARARAAAAAEGRAAGGVAAAGAQRIRPVNRSHFHQSLNRQF